MKLHSKFIFLEIAVPILAFVIILFWSPWLPKIINPGYLPDGTCEAGSSETDWVPFGRTYDTCYGDKFYITPWGFRVRVIPGDGFGNRVE
jgi:hypothetical protein